MHFEPIGIVRSRFVQASGTPIQPCRAAGCEGRVELLPQFVEGLQDLEGFDRIWLIYCFDRAAKPKMRVIPYRDTIEHGMFATRVPARPNPIGISCVKLLGIEGAILRLSEVDILDGTPLLDIKPYIPQYDNYPVDRCGWIDRLQRGPNDAAVVADGRFDKPRTCCGHSTSGSQQGTSP